MQRQVVVGLGRDAPVHRPFHQGKGMIKRQHRKRAFTIVDEPYLWAPPSAQAATVRQRHGEVNKLSFLDEGIVWVQQQQALSD
jgi:hypothetical protein